jgi:dsRNA-specific ribonuclease
MSHMSVPLGKVHENWITAFEEKLKETNLLIELNGEDVDASIFMFWNEMETAPKTLGDLYEALLGAVFLDSGFKIEPVQKIIQTTLLDVWWPRIEPLLHGSDGLEIQQPQQLIAGIVKNNQCAEFIVATHPQATGYLCEYTFHGNTIASVCLETKKESKKMAAIEALRYLKSNPNCFAEICTCEKKTSTTIQNSDDEEEL